MCLRIRKTSLWLNFVAVGKEHRLPLPGALRSTYSNKIMQVVRTHFVIS